MAAELLCCLCSKPIINGDAVHGAYTLAGTERHYECHVAKHPPFDRKKFDEDVKAADRKLKSLLTDLKRHLRDR